MLSANLHKELATSTGRGALNVDLTFHQGAITSLYGDSGVGKTIILRMLAGLENPDNGSIKYDGQAWLNDNGHVLVAPNKRCVGLVFQDYGLFPNMSIEENLRYADVDGNNAQLHYYLEVFGLTSLKDQRPDSLSGGQKQRTAIARALVYKPKVLLLDEPFTAQDRKMSTVIGKEILKYTKEHQCITVLVTHNIAATIQLATYIYSISKGEVVKEGSMEEVFLGSADKTENGIYGVIAEKHDMNEVVNLAVLANEQLFEVQVEESSQFEVGDEVFLKLNKDTGSFRLQKL